MSEIVVPNLPEFPIFWFMVFIITDTKKYFFKSNIHYMVIRAFEERFTYTKKKKNCENTGDKL